MGQAVLPGNPPIEITLRRSRQARRLSLRVSRLDGRITLSLPVRTPETEAMDFARSKEGWLRRTLQTCVVSEVPVIGGLLPVEGRELQVLAGTVRGVRLTEEAVLVPDDPSRVGPRLAGFLKVMARDRLLAASDHYSLALGRPYTGVSLRDTRSRWGSCSPDGKLMYSWRLIMAPPQVLDYVAAHEVAHLAEMNHGPNFWATVGQLCPGYAAPRNWLRRNGQELHRWRFTD